MKPLVSSVLILLSVSAVQAQIKLNQTIVVTATDLPETLESTPASVTVISKKQMQERGARDVADVLREVPGLTISRSGSPGKATSLFTRGGASTHTLVLWNGVEINNPYFAGYDWGRFSTAGVQQVEVVRGPFSALYGSDAVAGVVNVITTPQTNELRAELQSGGHGLRNAVIDGAYAGRSMHLSAGYEHREDDGFSANDDFRQNSGNVFALFGALGLAARYTSYDLGIPFNVNAAGTTLVPSLRRRQDGSERQFAIPIRSSVGRTSYELTLSESRRRDNFHDPDDPFGFIDASTDSSVRRARLTTRTATGIGTLIAGGELARDRVNDRSTFGVNLDNDRRKSNSFFVEDRWSHSGFELSAGARYDRFDTFGSQISPRVAAAWRNERGKYRAAYGEGFRAPSVGELYFPFSGNRNLDAEHSRSFEAGYDLTIGNDGLASMTLFSSRYRNLITFDNKTYAFANIGNAKSDGIELGFDDRLSTSLYASISYTLLRHPLPRRPKHSGTLTLGWRGDPLEASVTIVRSGARADILPVFPYSEVTNRAFTTIDAMFQCRAGRFAPFAKVENLGNARYQEVLGFPSPRRRLILGLRFTV